LTAGVSNCRLVAAVFNGLERKMGKCLPLRFGLVVAGFLCLIMLPVWTGWTASASGAEVPGSKKAPGNEEEPVARFSQSGVSPAEMDDEALDRIFKLQNPQQEEVRMILLPAAVTNRKGRAVLGLTKKDFTVKEDTIPQTIKYFTSETSEPIHIAFLLDVSGSMRQVGKLEAAKQAIRYFVESLRPTDRFALICFADEQVAWITDFTSDRKRFLARLDVQRGFGKSAIFDAVAAAPKLVDEKIKGKKAIVMITDGVDNASRLSNWRATKLARQVNVPIYALGFTALRKSLRLPGSTAVNLRVVATLARETGGVMYSVHDPDELKEAAAEIEGELRHQYLIGYYPNRRNWDGNFRRITLETNRSRLVVRTRKGYYAIP